MSKNNVSRTSVGVAILGVSIALMFGYLLISQLFSTKSIQGASPLSSVNGPYPLPATPTLLPPSFTLPPAKQTIEAISEQQHQNALKTPPPPGATKPPIPTINPNQTLVSPVVAKTAGAGTLMETGLAPLPGSIFRIENSWHVTMNNTLVTVFAGARRGDGAMELPRPWQGVLVVAVSTLDGLKPIAGAGGEYSTPIKDGSLSILDAQGARLILRSENGTTYYFDVPGRRFVSSLTEIVPTATQK